MRFLIGAMLLLFSCQAVLAEGVMKVMNLPYVYLPLKSVTVHTKIDYQIAVTTTRQTFLNDLGRAVKLKYGFQLPPQASVTAVRWFKNGQWYQGQIVGHPQDTTAVNPGGISDTQFLDYMGENPFFITFQDSLARDAMISVELTYLELLPFDTYRIWYRYPADLKYLISGRLDSFRVQIEVRRDAAFYDLQAPFQPGAVYTRTDTSECLNYFAQTILPDADFRATYQTRADSMQVVVLSANSAFEGGYFLVLNAPPADTAPAPPEPNVDLFLIDISGSMAGSKLNQAKKVVTYGLQRLTALDWFNIIAFNNQLNLFQLQPALASPENIARALQFIDELSADNKTNLQQALAGAFAQSGPAFEQRVIIVVTDGQTTLDFQAIQNFDQVPICVWGITPRPNRVLLNRLVENHRGLVAYPLEDNGDDCLASFFNKIHHPFLSQLQISMTGVAAFEVFPQTLPDLYAGEQLALVGRYQQAGAALLSIRGMNGNNLFHQDFNRHFARDSTAHPFVPKIWAKKKIEDLLVAISALKSNSSEAKVLIEQVLALSFKYGLTTPFTSYQDPGAMTEVAWGAWDPYFHPQANRPRLAELLPNYPNPFNAATWLHFRVGLVTPPAEARITIFNLLGALITEMTIPLTTAGDYQVSWDGRDRQLQPVPSGIYIFRLQIGAAQWQQKMLLLR